MFNKEALLTNNQIEQSIKLNIEMQNMNPDANYIKLEENSQHKLGTPIPDYPIVSQQPCFAFNNHPDMQKNLVQYPIYQHQYNLMRMQKQYDSASKSQLIYAICIHCRTHQLIKNEKEPFICFQCGVVTQTFFETIQCSGCKINVKYQTGISPIIKCTKCNTHNIVSSFVNK